MSSGHQLLTAARRTRTSSLCPPPSYPTLPLAARKRLRVLLFYWLLRKRALSATPPAYTPSCSLPNSRFPQAGHTRAHPTRATPMRRWAGCVACDGQPALRPLPPRSPSRLEAPLRSPAPPPPRRWQPVGTQWEVRAGGELIFQYRVRSFRGVGKSPAAAVAGRGVERGPRRSERPGTVVPAASYPQRTADITIPSPQRRGWEI